MSIPQHDPTDPPHDAALDREVKLDQVRGVFEHRRFDFYPRVVDKIIGDTRLRPWTLFKLKVCVDFVRYNPRGCDNPVSVLWTEYLSRGTFPRAYPVPAAPQTEGDDGIVYPEWCDTEEERARWRKLHRCPYCKRKQVHDQRECLGPDALYWQLAGPGSFEAFWGDQLDDAGEEAEDDRRRAA